MTCQVEGTTLVVVGTEGHDHIYVGAVPVSSC
jgi:hypothetical protein